MVRPIRFPGGSIGELAVNGTVNDLAVSGARPVALSAALILEEGLAADVLRAEVAAMAEAARSRRGPRRDRGHQGGGAREVRLDVRRDHGRRRLSSTIVALGPGQVRPGDKVLVSGTLGDHGVAIMLARGDLDIEADVRSDTQPLWALASALMDACGAGLHCMRDATRGGVATVLNEIALAAEVGVVIAEDRLPLRREVVGAGEILGIDPLYVANEGKLVAFVAAEKADAALAAARSVPAGADAALIGEVRAEPPGRVLAQDRVRRPPDDRHARRRPAAADLLTSRGGGAHSGRRTGRAAGGGAAVRAGADGLPGQGRTAGRRTGRPAGRDVGRGRLDRGRPAGPQEGAPTLPAGDQGG